MYDSTAIFCASLGSALMISGVRASSIRMLSASSTSMEKRRALHRLLAVAGRPHAQHAAQEVGLSLADPPQQQAVAKEIEAEFLGRAVGDVAGVGFAPVGLAHLRFDDADRHAQAFVDRPHPVGVAAGQVVVDRGQVRPLAFQRRQIQGQRGGQRLAFARLHLGDRAVVHGDAAQNLHVEVPHVERAPAGLAHQGKGLGQNVVQRFAALGAIAQRQAALAQVVRIKLLELFLERSNFGQHAGPAGNPPPHQAAGNSLQTGLQTLSDRAQGPTFSIRCVRPTARQRAPSTAGVPGGPTRRVPTVNSIVSHAHGLTIVWREANFCVRLAGREGPRASNAPAARCGRAGRAGRSWRWWSSWRPARRARPPDRRV